MKIINVCNQRAGVGKSSLAYHLAWGLFQSDISVLLIDLDPQGTLSSYFGIREKCETKSIFSIAPNLKYESVTKGKDGLTIDIVPSNIYLATTEAYLDSSQIENLGIAINNSQKTWDFLIIDSPSSFNLFAKSALLIADYFLVPCLPSYLDLFALKELFGVLKTFSKNIDFVDTKSIGILLNKTHEEVKNNEVIDIFRENYKDILYDSQLSETSILKEAVDSNLPIWEYEPLNKTSIHYLRFIKEFLEKTMKMRLNI